MKLQRFLSLVLSILALAGVCAPVQAQWVVVDPTSLTQLLIQVRQLYQQIQLAENTLGQAQQAYAAITGLRGMQNLLSGQNRNYLPMNWSQLTGAMSGAGGTYGALGSDVNATVERNAVLTPAQLTQFSAAEMQFLTQRRQTVALLEALVRAALNNTSTRFNTLQGLITAMSSATDEKGALDLHSRIASEQSMLQNENTKLAELYRAVQSEEETERERSDEQAIVDIGHFSELPPMGLLGSN
jgi:type IV secretion system protein VirB5